MRRSLVILSAVALLAVGCQGDGDSEGSTTTTVVSTISASGAAGSGAFDRIPNIVDRIQPSVVSVVTESGQGSGVVYDEKGFVLTNNHVAGDAQRIQIVLASGQTLPAELRAATARFDLAVLEVDRSGLPAATFARTLPEVGELAIAMGNPVGFENSVTAGIVSGLHREIPAGGTTPALVDLIQTDAAISPGNSGGALVNANAEVIGINVAFIPPEQRAVAIGFAIPSPTVIEVVRELLEDGTVEYAFLGINRPQPVTPEIAQQLGLERPEGVLVFEVIAGSPAEAAGLQAGDVILAIDSEEMSIPEDLFSYLRTKDPGDEVTVTVNRDGEERQITTRLVDLPAPE